jgi:hypothetical protein
VLSLFLESFVIGLGLGLSGVVIASVGWLLKATLSRLRNFRFLNKST